MCPATRSWAGAGVAGDAFWPGEASMTGKRPPSRGSGPSDRAQSVFDYSIGISIFVVVILGVLLFVPTAFASFGGSGNGPADGLTAQRGADHLTGSILASSGGESDFSFGCTLLLFRGSASHPSVDRSPAECGFQPGASLASKLGYTDTQPANVTIEADIDSDPDREILCWDSDANPPTSDADSDVLKGVGDGDCGDAAADVPLSRGSSAADNGNFAAAERYGTLKNQPVYVVVRVW